MFDYNSDTTFTDSESEKQETTFQNRQSETDKNKPGKCSMVNVISKFQGLENFKYVPLEEVTQQEIDKNYEDIEKAFIKATAKYDFQPIKSDLPKDVKFKLMKLLLENLDIFALEGEPIPVTPLMEYEIRLKDETPIRSRPYQVTPKERNILSQKIADLLKQKVIEPTISNFSHPIILIKKKNSDS